MTYLDVKVEEAFRTKFASEKRQVKDECCQPAKFLVNLVVLKHARFHSRGLASAVLWKKH